MSLKVLAAPQSHAPLGNPPVEGKTKKTPWELISQFVLSKEGTKRFFDSINCGARWTAYLPFGQKKLNVITKVADAADVAATGTYCLDAVVDTKTFCESAASLKNALADPQKKNLRGIAKKTCVDGCTVVGDLSESTKFFFGAAGKTPPKPISGISNVAWLAVDSSSLRDQVKEIGKTNELIAKSHLEEEKSYLNKLKQLCYIKSVRDVSSVAGGIIASLSLVFVAVQNFVLVPPVALFLTTVFIVSSVATYFFDHSIKQSTNLSQ